MVANKAGMMVKRQIPVQARDQIPAVIHPTWTTTDSHTMTINFYSD
jgi:hypothetical protein